MQHGSSLDLNMTGDKVEYPGKPAAESLTPQDHFSSVIVIKELVIHMSTLHIACNSLAEDHPISSSVALGTGQLRRG